MRRGTNGTTLAPRAPRDRRELRAVGRREFLGVCTGAVAGLAAGGCASVMTQRVGTIDGRVSFALADYPELRAPGGALTIQPDGLADPLLVLNIGDGKYSVLSPICTHRACTVELAGERLECPCHGSAYDREGRVLNGPAERALTRYAASVQGDRLVIDVGRGG